MPESCLLPRRPQSSRQLKGAELDAVSVRAEVHESEIQSVQFADRGKKRRHYDAIAENLCGEYGKTGSVYAPADIERRHDQTIYAVLLLTNAGINPNGKSDLQPRTVLPFSFSMSARSPVRHPVKNRTLKQTAAKQTNILRMIRDCMVQVLSGITEDGVDSSSCS